MATVTYQCPCCTAPLEYDGRSGRLQCASCGNEFELAALESIAETAKQGEGVMNYELPGEEFSTDETGKIRAYVCKNCGAELITDDTTTATVCAYCGSPTVLPGQLDNAVRPDIVLPFRVTKDQATNIFRGYFNGKKLMPNVFRSTDNRIAEVRKLYVPYWLFNCEAYGDISFRAEKKEVRREGNFEVTRTKHYLVRRSGSMRFENLPVDASDRFDNKLSESIEPFEMKESLPFAPAMLAGAQADHADVDAKECEDRANERVVDSMGAAIRSTVTGYTSFREEHRYLTTRNGKVTSALMPVWIITTEKNEGGQKKTYTFAINGQTGEYTCDVPYAKDKAAKWFLGLFAGICAGGYALLLLLTNLGVI